MFFFQLVHIVLRFVVEFGAGHAMFFNHCVKGIEFTKEYMWVEGWLGECAFVGVN